MKRADTIKYFYFQQTKWRSIIFGQHDVEGWRRSCTRPNILLHLARSWESWAERDWQRVSTITWSYYSHVNPTKDTNSGLVGPLVICKKASEMYIAKQSVFNTCNLASISSSILSFWQMWTSWLIINVQGVWFLTWAFLTYSLAHIRQKEKIEAQTVRKLASVNKQAFRLFTHDCPLLQKFLENLYPWKSLTLRKSSQC